MVGGTAASGPWPLLGRDPELSAFDSLLAPDSRCGFIEVAGEPGIGKSRLVAEVCHRARATGWSTAWGTAGEAAGESERDPPYGVLIDALDDHLADRAGTAELLEPHHLGRLAPVFPALRGTRPPGSPEAPADRYTLHRAFAALLAALAPPGGLLLVLDDVHRADPASAELISYVRRHAPLPRVRVVAIRRTRGCPGPRAGSRPGVAGSTHRIELGPLDRAAVARLLGPGTARARCAELHRASGGNPLYLEVLARAPGSPGTERSPAELDWGHAKLLSEFRFLSASTRLVAEAISVLDRPSDPELIAVAAETDTSGVLAGTADLFAADLLREAAPGAAGGGVEFRHPLLRRAVYESANPLWRRGAHARVGALLRSQGAPIQVVAPHVARSARVGDDTAAELLVEAARTAARHAPGTAAGLLRSALGVWIDPADPRRVGVQLDLAAALLASGDPSAAHDALRDALPLLAPDADGRRSDAIRMCAAAERLLGRWDAAADLLHHELSSHRPGAGATAALWRELARTEFHRADPGTARAAAVRARDVAEEHGDRAGAAAAASITAYCLAAMGEIEAADAESRAAGRLVDGLSDAEAAPVLEDVMWLPWAEGLLQRFGDALRHVERWLGVARSTGRDAAVSDLLTCKASALTWLGRLREAAECTEDAVDAARRMRADTPLLPALVHRSLVLAARGDIEGARTHCDEAVLIAATRQPLFGPLAEFTAGAVRFAAGEQAVLHRDAVPGPGARPRPPDFPLRAGLYALLTASALRSGDPGGAELFAAEAQLSGSAELLPCSTGFARLARSMVLVARGSAGEGLDAARAAVGAFERAGAVAAAGIARLGAASACAAAGDRAAALDELDRAAHAFIACGADRLLLETVRRQRRLGRRVPRPGAPRRSRERGGDLTPREAEIAALAARGRTNREIADTLVISEHTVETHLSRVYAKLGVSSRTALAAHLRDDSGDPV
ncbi:ATP-binding protein [Nocardiopsis mangrovi]|uniref:ATP-binding protein n=1 Tax=Nocardiopsis mangrovi TaxID=1179818 RepID=A0ABV9DRD7_9ACTN